MDLYVLILTAGFLAQPTDLTKASISTSATAHVFSSMESCKEMALRVGTPLVSKKPEIEFDFDMESKEWVTKTNSQYVTYRCVKSQLYK